MAKAKQRPKTKKFNGMTYRLSSGHKSEAGAKQAAIRLRQKGYNARHVKDASGTGWGTYRGLPKREKKITDREAREFFKL